MLNRIFQWLDNSALAQILRRNPKSASAEFFPFFKGRRSRVLSRGHVRTHTKILRRPLPETPERCPIDGLAVPPAAYFMGYDTNPAQYLESGRRDFQSMKSILAGACFDLDRGNKRILDFGCASGRMLRAFTGLTQPHELWGVDIRADLILWSQLHLSPPMRFATVTTFPHLPFEDRSFDLVYAGSVFTHIGDLEDMWLLELRRLLKPGGFLFVTVHDTHTIDLIISSHPGESLHTSPLRSDLRRLKMLKGSPTRFQMATIEDERGTQVFHDRDFIRKRWGQYFEVQGIHSEGHDYQTAVVLTKELA